MRNQTKIRTIKEQSLTMFFVAQPEYYRQVSHRVTDLNEMCLLNGLQRQYAYRQQQREKRQIQKLNQPEIELTQDLENYYVILTKMVNNNNHNYMYKFDGYSLKQFGRSLVIRSARDNFYRNITLPSNTDLDRDINYKILNRGYKMVVSIPKKRSYQIKTATFGLPDILDGLGLNLLSSSTCGNGQMRNGAAIVSAEKADQRDEKVGSGSESCGIRIPISHEDINTEEFPLESRGITENETGEETHDATSTPVSEPTVDTPTQDASLNATLCQVGGEGRETVEGETRYQGAGERERAIQSGKPQKEGVDQPDQAFETTGVSGQVSPPPNVSNSDIIGGQLGESKNGGDICPSEGPSASLLKNYVTLQRKTVFLPNTSTTCEDDASMDIDENNKEEEEIAIPVRRVKSPTIEDVVDEEFL